MKKMTARRLAKGLRLSALVFSLLASSEWAMAFVSGYGYYGKSWYNGVTKVGGDDKTFGLHFDPLPLIPISFGLSLTTAALDKDDLGSGTQAELSSTQAEVMAWIPMVPFVTPYGKLGLLLSGEIEVKDANGNKTKSDFGGVDMAVGIKRSIFPMVKILLEGGKSSYTLKDDDFGDKSLRRDFFRLGVEVGI